MEYMKGAKILKISIGTRLVYMRHPNPKTEVVEVDIQTAGIRTGWRTRISLSLEKAVLLELLRVIEEG